MEITKVQILEAIAREPLRAGWWITPTAGEQDLATCPVCAVGGVLRSVGVQPERVAEVAARATRRDRVCPDDADEGSTVDDMLGEARELADEGLYMNALSVAFEGLSGLRVGPDHMRLDMGSIRDELAEFVTEHFPAVVRLDV